MRPTAPHLVLGLLLTVRIYGAFLVEAQSTNFSFLSFTTPEEFLMAEDVQYYPVDDAFLMNPGATSLAGASCGRLFYRERVRMKDDASGAVASFSTAFTFEIKNLNPYYGFESGPLQGDGMAFTFAKSSNLTGESQGRTLCLLKIEDDGKASNHVFAVEFDTFLNTIDDYGINDISDSHIGVNVNSMHSKWSHNLCGGTTTNCSYLCNGGQFTAWIDYDSAAQKLEVRFADGSLPAKIGKPSKPVITATNLSLTEILAEEYLYVGFSSSVGAYREVHTITAWNFVSSGMPERQTPHDSSRGRTIGIVSGACAGAAGALLLVFFLIAKHRRRRRTSSSQQQGKFILMDQNLVPRKFTYKELGKATNNFSRSELLGSGGFGAVYKGTLPSGAVVAVKRMKHESKHGKEGFQAEAASLSQIRHRNLVQLRGWCHEEEQLLLVYDYMCNGSLDEWLFHIDNRRASSKFKGLEALPWKMRHFVLSGVAAALAYLHEECVQCVLHRDIKSSNVLLDANLNAYLGDFGLARLVDHQKEEKTTMMAGTLGYMAPEMPHTGKATKESDAYSFGVLMLEVMCGERPLDVRAIERGDGILVDRVWRAHETGNILQAADSRLETLPPSHQDSSSPFEIESQGPPSSTVLIEEMLNSEHASVYVEDDEMEEKKMVTNLLHLGLLCCNPNPQNRPSMRLASQLLQSPEKMELAMPALPAFKPVAQYSRPGFSELAIDHSSTSSDEHLNMVQESGRGSYQTDPPSSSLPHGRANVDIRKSYASPISSSVFTGH